MELLLSAPACSQQNGTHPILELQSWPLRALPAQPSAAALDTAPHTDQARPGFMLKLPSKRCASLQMPSKGQSPNCLPGHHTETAVNKGEWQDRLPVSSECPDAGCSLQERWTLQVSPPVTSTPRATCTALHHHQPRALTNPSLEWVDC